MLVRFDAMQSGKGVADLHARKAKVSCAPLGELEHVASCARMGSFLLVPIGAACQSEKRNA